jgi:hypothetical protein
LKPLKGVKKSTWIRRLPWRLRGLLSDSRPYGLRVSFFDK